MADNNDMGGDSGGEVRVAVRVLVQVTRLGLASDILPCSAVSQRIENNNAVMTLADNNEMGGDGGGDGGGEVVGGSDRAGACL